MALGEIEAKMHGSPSEKLRLTGQLRFEYLFANLNVDDGHRAQRLDFVDLRQYRTGPRGFSGDAQVFRSNAEPGGPVTRIRLDRNR